MAHNKVTSSFSNYYLTISCTIGAEFFKHNSKVNCIVCQPSSLSHLPLSLSPAIAAGLFAGLLRFPSPMTWLPPSPRHRRYPGPLRPLLGDGPPPYLSGGGPPLPLAQLLPATPVPSHSLPMVRWREVRRPLPDSVAPPRTCLVGLQVVGRGGCRCRRRASCRIAPRRAPRSSVHVIVVSMWLDSILQQRSSIGWWLTLIWQWRRLLHLLPPPPPRRLKTSPLSSRLPPTSPPCCPSYARRWSHQLLKQAADQRFQPMLLHVRRPVRGRCMVFLPVVTARYTAVTTATAGVR
jgi:hypothetical protein